MSEPAPAQSAQLQLSECPSKLAKNPKNAADVATPDCTKSRREEWASGLVIAAMHSADVEVVEIVELGRVIGVNAVTGFMVGCLVG